MSTFQQVGPKRVADLCVILSEGKISGALDWISLTHQQPVHF